MIGPGDPNGRYDVRTFGAKGDGITDDTAILQGIIDEAVPSSELFFPVGVYIISATLDCGWKAMMFRGIGPGRAAGAARDEGSLILGTFDGPLIRMESGSSHFGGGVTDLGLINYGALGVGISVNGQQGTISRVGITAYRGIITQNETFSWMLNGCSLLSNKAPGSIGIYANGHVYINGCDVTAFEHGVRMCGSSSLIGGRIEVNRAGIMLGLDLAGNPSGWVGTIEGVTLEANDVGLYIENGGGHIAAVHIQGSAGAPCGQSIAGVKVRIASNLTLVSVQAVTAYSLASFDFTHPELTINRMTMISCYGQNGYAPFTTWAIPQGAPPITFINCNDSESP